MILLINDLLYGSILHGLSAEIPSVFGFFLRNSSNALIWITLCCKLTWYCDTVVQRRSPRHSDIIQFAATCLDVQLSPTRGSSRVPEVWNHRLSGRGDSDEPAAGRTCEGVRPPEDGFTWRRRRRWELRSSGCPSVGDVNVPVTAAGEEDCVAHKL